MATTFDTHKNLAISAIATAPGTNTANATGVTMVVTAGQGGRFAAGMNATVCPAGTTPDPSNSEIVRITGVSTDTLTVTRTVESSSLRTVGVGDVIFAGPSIKSLTDIEGAVNTVENLTAALQYPSLGNTNAVVSGTTYTTVLADANTYIDTTSASATAITIPANATVAYPVGTTIVVTQKAAGQVTVSVTTDTLNYYSPSSAGTCQTAGQWAAVTLRKVTSTAWIAYGAK
jgi:tryptophan synthase beta subunit